MSYRDDRQEIKAEDYLNHMRYQPDVAQRNVICHDDDGLLYVNAGPGSGKTKTLVHRIVYLLMLYPKLRPEDFMILTFSRKAALELTTRLSKELSDNGISLNTSEMYIGTFHSQCFALRNDYHHLLKPEEKEIDSDDNTLDSYEIIELYVNRLLDNPDVLSALSKRIKFVIVDECQDNSERQWEFLLKLSRAVNNICVVGDYNQSIYRFRRAVPESFLNFPTQFRNEIGAPVTVKSLTKNYRSRKGIIDLCNSYSKWCGGSGVKPAEMEYPGGSDQITSVYRTKYNSFEDAGEKIAQLISQFREKGVIHDLSDVAILTYSPPKLNQSGFLPKLSEKINVYAPHAFFLKENQKIRELIGCALKYFLYTKESFSESCKSQAKDCLNAAEALCQDPRYSQLKQFLFSRKTSYSHLVRELLKQNPFKWTIHRDEKRRFTQFFRKYDSFRFQKKYSLENDPFFKYTDSFRKNPSGKIKLSPVIRKLIGCAILQIYNREKAFADDKVIQKCIVEARNLMDKNPDLKAYVEKNRYYFNHSKASAPNEKGLYFQTDEKLSDILYRLLGYEPFRSYADTPIVSVANADTQQIEQLFCTKNIGSMLSAVAEEEKLHPFASVACILEKVWTSAIKEFDDKEYVGIPGFVSVMSVHQVKGLDYPVVIVDIDSFRHINEAKKDTDGGTEEGRRLFYTACSRAKDLLILADIKNENHASLNENIADAYLKETSFPLTTLCDNNGDVDDSLSLPPAQAQNSDNMTLLRSYSYTGDYSVFSRCPRRYLYSKLLHYPFNGADVAVGLIAHTVAEKINRDCKENKQTDIGAEIEAAMLDNKRLSPQKQKRLLNRMQVYNKYIREEYARGNRPEYIEKHLTDICTNGLNDRLRYVLSGKLDLVTLGNGKYILYDIKSETCDNNKRDNVHFPQLYVYCKLLQKHCPDIATEAVRLLYLNMDDNSKSYQVAPNITLFEQRLDDPEILDKKEKSLSDVDDALCLISEAVNDNKIDTFPPRHNCKDRECPLRDFCFGCVKTRD